MNLNYLLEFITLAQIGKYHEASEVLFLSQSSLSKHIQALEHELGVPLFDRSNHKVTLTKYGTALLPHANKIWEHQICVEKEFENLKCQNRRPVLIVGASPVIPLYRFTSCFTAFIQNNPCEIRILNQSANHLKAMIQQGTCDFAIMYNTNIDVTDDFETSPYTEDCLAVILPINHPLAKKPFVRLSDLKDEVFAEVEKAPILNTFLSRQDQMDSDFYPMIDFEVETPHQLIGLVSSGLAVSLLGSQSVKHFSTNDITAVLIEPAIPLQVRLFYSNKYQQKNITEKLLDSISNSI